MNPDHLPAEIDCPGCGKESLLLRKPQFEGFRKTGESLKCASCGHEFASEAEVPFRVRKGPAIFDVSELPAKTEVFDQEEHGRLCRHCQHYIVNPFTQWCAVHKKEVEATDVCPQFEQKKVAEEKAADSKKPIF